MATSSSGFHSAALVSGMRMSSPAVRGVSLYHHRSERGSCVRASNIKEPGQNNGEEWRPPSDWDKAWEAFKKAPPSSPTSSSASTPSPTFSQGASTSGSGSGSGSSGSSNVGSRRRQQAAMASQRGKPLLRGMDKYVTWNPQGRVGDYPLAEETDPVRVNERIALDVWTDGRFTYAGFGVVALLLVVMVVVVGPPPA